MATLKLRHLILFIISFLLVVLSDLPGGAMLLLFVWMQIALILWKKPFTLKNQIKTSVLFLFLLPTFFLWGAVNSFISIYIKESHFIFMMMYSLLSFILCFWITLFSVFSFAYAKEQEPVLNLFSESVKQIKTHKNVIFYISLLVYLISILPIPIAEDYRIALGIIIGHSALKWDHLKILI
jgi:hypothetical protein